MDETGGTPALRRRTVLLVAVLRGATLLWTPSARAARARLGAYRGLGSWVDIYDEAQLHRPAFTVRRMHDRGVRTLFLETSNYSRDRAIMFPAAMERFIHAAHARGMKVVAWYLPGFKNMKRDRRRSMAAIRFRTSQGQSFDSFGLDIEASIVDPPAKRTRRLLALSRFLRRRVGPTYPLGAIIPSPRGIQLVHGYWPKFPYEKLARIYDVFVPMGYYTYRTNSREEARDYTRRNIQIIRRKTGIPGVPIHVIGGIAGDSSRGEVRGFVRAAREHGVLGASLYGFDQTTSGHWAELAAVPVNPRQRVPLPARLSHDAPLGNVPGKDRHHPKEVSFRAAGRTGAQVLSFEAFDVQADEVEVLVNWRSLGTVPVTPSGAWGTAVAMPVPDGMVHDDARNYVLFVAAGDYPGWSTWGVRNVGLAPAP